MITLIAVVAVVLFAAAYSIGHYHGTQQCNSEMELTSRALAIMSGKHKGEKDEKNN